MMLSKNEIHIVPAIIISIILLILTYTLNKMLEKALHKLAQSHDMDIQIINALKTIVNFSVYSIGIILILENLHIQISALFGTFGVLAIGVGFALQNLLPSIVSGILILHYKPYYIGNYVSFTCNEMQRGVEGKIIDINLRETTLEFEKNTIVIPNRLIYSCAVTIDKNKSSRV